MSTNVKFFFTDEFKKYQELPTKDPMALYFIEDTAIGYSALYKGDNLIAVGSNASGMTAGLMSIHDKKNLDEIVNTGGGIGNLQAADSSIELADCEDGKKSVGVSISKQEGNYLNLASDGLFVGIDLSAIVGAGMEADGNTVAVKVAEESGGLVASDAGLSIVLATEDEDGALSKEDKALLNSIPESYATKEEVEKKSTWGVL